MVAATECQHGQHDVGQCQAEHRRARQRQHHVGGTRYRDGQAENLQNSAPRRRREDDRQRRHHLEVHRGDRGVLEGRACAQLATHAGRRHLEQSEHRLQRRPVQRLAEAEQRAGACTNDDRPQQADQLAGFAGDAQRDQQHERRGDEPPHEAQRIVAIVRRPQR